ncbi:MAG: hypothetical protein H6670_01220 [Anaerolineaceae bacterium]|nr:hypothetical protein [Anaerolineae bacterium]MCB9458238.1 hypothetical protein [Anaerolineaceae bacterium]
MSSKLARKLLQLTIYAVIFISIFLALMFVATQVVWAIFLSIPPLPHCGGFNCLGEGFLVGILSLMGNIVISLLATMFIFRRFVLKHRKRKRKRGLIQD